MADRNIFSPHTRRFGEREITRIQEDFSGGLYRDITKIPDNALADLKNVVSKGEYIETRSGSRVWGNWSTTTEHAAMPTTDTYNGAYYHKIEKRIFLQLGTKLYYSDGIYMPSWTECICCSTVALSDTVSRFSEYQHYLFIFNDNGVFKVDVNHTPHLYYKINLSVPSTIITDSNASSSNSEVSTDSTTYPYGRKYLITFSRIAGGVFTDRQTSGSYIELESGSTKINGTTLKDYGVVWAATVNFQVGTLTLESDSRPFTHYSLYSTKDIGENGSDPVTGIGNNKELFIWNQDVPLARAMKVSYTTPSPSVYVMTIQSGYGNTTYYDIGCTVKDSSGNTYTISSRLDDSSYLLTAAGTGTNIGACIGGGDIKQCNGSTIASGINTITVAASYFSSADVGKPIFWGDGDIEWITEYVNATSVKIKTTDTTDRTNMWFTMNPVSRSAYDTILEEELQARINFAYTLNQRYYDPLPNLNTGIVTNGFIIGATREKGDVYYSSISQGFEHFGGWYFSPGQYITIKDNIIEMSEHQDKVIIWCSNSTHGIPVNAPDIKTDNVLGTAMAIIPGQYVVSSSIGLSDYGGVCYLEDGKVIVITNEPGIRIFDGTNFSDNCLLDRLEIDFRVMNREYVITNDGANGVVIWGRE